MDPRRFFKHWMAAAAIVALVGAGAVAGRGTSAQEATPAAGDGDRSTVTVNGSGSVMMTPDTAWVSVGVNIVNASLSEAQAQAATQMNAVIGALKAAGIDEKDIQTSNYSVNVLQEYDNSGNPARVSGYQVNNQVSVTVREIDKLGEILESAVAAGANSIYGITFTVADTTGGAKQARADAIADATSKAEQIAEATGMKVGRIVSATEMTGPPPILREYGGMGMAEADMAAVPIQTGSNIVTVDIQVTFELVP